MTQYCEYRGLLGEKVRVPAHTISKTSPHYDHGSYPYVEMAGRQGKDRDQFAKFALFHRPFFEDAMRDRAAASFRTKRVPELV